MARQHALMELQQEQEARRRKACNIGKRRAESPGSQADADGDGGGEEEEDGEGNEEEEEGDVGEGLVWPGQEGSEVISPAGSEGANTEGQAFKGKLKLSAAGQALKAELDGM